MADILRFVPKPLPPLHESGEDESRRGPGEVIIFPGVRVERESFRLSDRMTDLDDSPKPGQRRQPKQSGR